MNDTTPNPASASIRPAAPTRTDDTASAGTPGVRIPMTEITLAWICRTIEQPKLIADASTTPTQKQSDGFYERAAALQTIPAVAATELSSSGGRDADRRGRRSYKRTDPTQTATGSTRAVPCPLRTNNALLG